MSIATPNGFQLDNSGKRVVVDPITRIEGHLRIEVNVDDEQHHPQRSVHGHDVARPRGHPPRP